jgi:hypothetical protein
MKALNNHRGSLYGRGSKGPFTGNVPGVPDSHFRPGKNPRPPLNRREKIPLFLFYKNSKKWLTLKVLIFVAISVLKCSYFLKISAYTFLFIPGFQCSYVLIFCAISVCKCAYFGLCLFWVCLIWVIIYLHSSKCNWKWVYM